MSKRIKVKVTTYVTIVEDDLHEYTDSGELEERVEDYLNDTRFIADDPYDFDICTGVEEYEIVDTWDEED
jgi:hypothetical protein